MSNGPDFNNAYTDALAPQPPHPVIPYGYRQVTGQLQKGDGVWDEAAGKFKKVRKEYPFVGTRELFAIRKCEVVQREFGEMEDINK